mmetsp:Transcript_8707/g.26812  ORF Transcript_8707/g.26812 Transcript_8707/m.26812 type:complete len:275 (-) Transcript_8707:154-978(-)
MEVNDAQHDDVQVHGHQPHDPHPDNSRCTGEEQQQGCAPLHGRGGVAHDLPKKRGPEVVLRAVHQPPQPGLATEPVGAAQKGAIHPGKPGSDFGQARADPDDHELHLRARTTARSHGVATAEKDAEVGRRVSAQVLAVVKDNEPDVASTDHRQRPLGGIGRKHRHQRDRIEDCMHEHVQLRPSVVHVMEDGHFQGTRPQLVAHGGEEPQEAWHAATPPAGRPVLLTHGIERVREDCIPQKGLPRADHGEEALRRRAQGDEQQEEDVDQDELQIP